MELGYHSSAYRVEELKSSESRLLQQLSHLEKQKRELSDLRLQELDTQAVLQGRYVATCTRINIITTKMVILINNNIITIIIIIIIITTIHF